MKVVTINIPPRGRHRMEGRGTIGYLSGDVPRLVIRTGSDAFDLWEGQCLPFEANSVYICNPFGRSVTITLIYNGPICYAINPDSANRHAEKTTYFMRWAPYAVDPAKRLGMVFLSTRGRYEITPDMSGHTMQSIRVTSIHGANPNFLAQKPVGTFESPQNPMNAAQKIQVDSCMAISGLYTDADTYAWQQSTPDVEVFSHGHYTHYNASHRVITEPGVAISVSFNEGFLPLGCMVIRDLGQMAEDFD